MMRTGVTECGSGLNGQKLGVVWSTALTAEIVGTPVSFEDSLGRQWTFALTTGGTLSRFNAVTGGLSESVNLGMTFSAANAGPTIAPTVACGATNIIFGISDTGQTFARDALSLTTARFENLPGGGNLDSAPGVGIDLDWGQSAPLVYEESAGVWAVAFASVAKTGLDGKLVKLRMCDGQMGTVHSLGTSLGSKGALIVDQENLPTRIFISGATTNSGPDGPRYFVNPAVAAPAGNIARNTTTSQGATFRSIGGLYGNNVFGGTGRFLDFSEQRFISVWDPTTSYTVTPFSDSGGGVPPSMQDRSTTNQFGTDNFTVASFYDGLFYYPRADGIFEIFKQNGTGQPFVREGNQLVQADVGAGGLKQSAPAMFVEPGGTRLAFYANGPSGALNKIVVVNAQVGLTTPTYENASRNTFGGTFKAKSAFAMFEVPYFNQPKRGMVLVGVSSTGPAVHNLIAYGIDDTGPTTTYNGTPTFPLKFSTIMTLNLTATDVSSGNNNIGKPSSTLDPMEVRFQIGDSNSANFGTLYGNSPDFPTPGGGASVSTFKADVGGFDNPTEAFTAVLNKASFTGWPADGIHTISVSARDVADNYGAPFTFSVLIDSTVPTVTNITLAAASTNVYIHSGSVQGSCDTLPCAYYTNTKGNGSFTVQANLQDSLAGLATASVKFAAGSGFGLGATNTLHSYPTNPTTVQNFTLPLPLISISSSTTYTNTMTVEPVDALGNTGTGSYEVILDTLAPRGTALRNGLGGTSQNTISNSTILQANWDAFVDDRVANADADGAGLNFYEVGLGTTAADCESDAPTISYVSNSQNLNATFNPVGFPDGTYFFKVKATDLVTNSGHGAAACLVGPALTLDATAPTLTNFRVLDGGAEVFAPFPAGTYTLELSFSEVMDTAIPATVTFGHGAPAPVVAASGGTNGWVNTVTGQNWLGTVTFPDEDATQADGNQTITFSAARDLAFNIMTLSDTVRLFDTKKPLVTNQSLDNGQTYATSLNLNLSFNSNDPAGATPPASGLVHYWYSFQTAQPDPATVVNKTQIPLAANPVSLIVTAPGEGTQTVWIWAEDAAGNLGTPVSDDILIDVSAPTVTNVIISTSQGLTNSQAIALASTETVTVTISFSEPMSGSFNPTVTFGTATPFASGGAFTAAPGWISTTEWQGQFVVAANSQNGLHSLRITNARDEVGNLIPVTDTDSGPLQEQLEIDTIAPVVSNVLAENGALFVTVANINFTFDVSDGTGSGILTHYYELDQDNGGIKPVPATATDDPGGSPGNLAAGDGAHTVFVWAIDRALNVGVADSDDIHVDLLPPGVVDGDITGQRQANQPGTGDRFIGPGQINLELNFTERMADNPPPSAQVQAPDGTLLNVFFISNGYTAGTNNQNWTGSINSSQLTGDGTYTVNVTGAQDPAGNEIAPFTIPFNYDGTAPQVQTAQFLKPDGQPLETPPGSLLPTYSGTTVIGNQTFRILDLEVNTNADGQGVGQTSVFYRLDVQFGINDPVQIGAPVTLNQTGATFLQDQIIQYLQDANSVQLSVWAEDLLGNATDVNTGFKTEIRIDTEPIINKPTVADIVNNPDLINRPDLIIVAEDSVTTTSSVSLLLSEGTIGDYEGLPNLIIDINNPVPISATNIETFGGTDQELLTLLSLAGEPGTADYQIRPMLDQVGNFVVQEPPVIVQPDPALELLQVLTAQINATTLAEGLFEIRQVFFDQPAGNQTSSSVFIIVDRTPAVSYQPGQPDLTGRHTAGLASDISNSSFIFNNTFYVPHPFFSWRGSLDDRPLTINVPNANTIRLEYQFSRNATPDDTLWRNDLRQVAQPPARSASSNHCGWRTALPAKTVEYCIEGTEANLPNGGGDGRYNLFVRTTDSAGNRGQSSVAFVLDTEAPDIIPDNLREGQVITFRDDDKDGSLVEGPGFNRFLSGSWTIDDDLQRITIYICPQGTPQDPTSQYAGCTETHLTNLYDLQNKHFLATTETALEVNEYVAHYEAVDLAGNKHTVSLNFKVSNKVAVELLKKANSLEAETGDVIQYEISLALNPDSEGDSMVRFELIDQPAPVLRFVPKSARLLYGGRTYIAPEPIDDPAAPGRFMRFVFNPAALTALNPNLPAYTGLDITSSVSIPDTTPNKLVLTYYMIVGAARPGDNRYTNKVTYLPLDPGTREFITAQASVIVRGREGVFRVTGIVLGKVYFDRNNNGVQDRDDPGLPNIRMMMENGMAVDTGVDGKYSVSGLSPGKHVLKLYPPSLPKGMKPRNSLSQFIDVPRSGMTIVDFGLVQ